MTRCDGNDSFGANPYDLSADRTCFDRCKKLSDLGRNLPFRLALARLEIAAGQPGLPSANGQLVWARAPTKVCPSPSSCTYLIALESMLKHLGFRHRQRTAVWARSLWLSTEGLHSSADACSAGQAIKKRDLKRGHSSFARGEAHIKSFCSDSSPNILSLTTVCVCTKT